MPESAHFRRAINSDPNFGREYSALALVYHNLGQFGEREKHRTMAIYYLIHRNFRNAISELTELLAKYPADYSGLTDLALAYFYARNYSLAKEMGLQAVKLYPNNS